LHTVLTLAIFKQFRTLSSRMTPDVKLLTIQNSIANAVTAYEQWADFYGYAMVHPVLTPAQRELEDLIIEFAVKERPPRFSVETLAFLETLTHRWLRFLRYAPTGLERANEKRQEEAQTSEDAYSEDASIRAYKQARGSKAPPLQGGHLWEWVNCILNPSPEDRYAPLNTHTVGMYVATVVGDFPRFRELIDAASQLEAPQRERFHGGLIPLLDAYSQLEGHMGGPFGVPR
jgi:hypothetical protein